PTVRTLRQVYEDYESNVDPDLLGYLGSLPRDRQRRLLLLLESMETIVLPGEEGKGEAVEREAEKDEGNGRRRRLRGSVRSSGIRG
ncbi:MAG: hypothetical protein V3S20_03260, partial [Dehalococcoidia bacterium]